MTRNPLSQLASLGEEVIGRASQNPTAAKFVQSAVQLKERVDDLTRRVRGLEAMERRIEQLEKRVAGLEGGKRPKSSSSSRGAKTAAKSAAPKGKASA